MKKTMMFLAAGLLLALPSAYANQINPGDQNIAPDVFSNTSNYNIVASISGSGSNSTAGGSLNISYNEYVAADQNNVFCPGCLDFAFQVTNTGPGDHIESLSTASFAGFLTDAGYFSGIAGVDPNSVSRDSQPGSVIHFDFTGNGDILAGQSSAYLVVETDATSWTAGSITAQDGATVDVAGFAPVPEPMTMGLLGGGLLLLGLLGYRRRKAVKL
ncbi:MAG TPA: PEP-CTERM sorting domain-containing protein [Bryobacteraceae bacterium]